MTKKQNSHIVEFKLKPTENDVRAINIKFEVARRLYNSTLSELFRRNTAMRTTSRWPALSLHNHKVNRILKKLNTVKTLNKKQKLKLTKALALKSILTKKFNALRKEFGVSEYDLNTFSKTNKNNCYFKDHLDANTIQKIDKRVMDSFDRWCFKSGGKPRFKGKNRAFKSLEGKSNKQGLRFILSNDKAPTRIAWCGLNIPVRLDTRDKSGYQAFALQSIKDCNVAFTRIIKRTIKGKDKLYAQVVIKGPAFTKKHHQTAFAKVKGKRVGLDLGISSLAYYSDTGVGLLTGINEIKQLQKKLRYHQANASRLLRLANPDNYERAKKQKGRKEVVVYRRKKNVKDSIRTKHWKKENAKVVELHRKMAAKRKYMHDIYSNEILSNGNIIFTEKVSTKAWQKIFGKSINAFAPAKLISVLSRKAENADGKVENINTWKAKLSQYDHISNHFIKKKLSDRVALVGGVDLVQRDLYSAFLAYCIDLKKESVCRATAVKQWPGARLRLDAAVKQLLIAKGRNLLPSSAGLAQLERPSRGAIAA